MSNAEACRRYCERHPQRVRKANRRRRARRLRRYPEHDVWRGMLARCYNTNHDAYPYYGGRGIKVCERWRRSFAAFSADVGHRPTAKHQLERPKNNENYGPKNWEWALPSQQQRNKRDNYIVVWRGERKCLTDWAKSVPISRDALRYRIREGWPLSRALTEPAYGGR